MKKALIILLIFTSGNIITNAQASLGEKVDKFTAIDQNGEEWALKKHLKESDYLVVYFYPASFTGGCTKQACSFRDQKGELEAVKASVVGVSGDKSETLGLFALEHSLNFTLLADESGEVARIFGVPQKEGKTIQREIKGETLDLVRGTTIQRWTFILTIKAH